MMERDEEDQEDLRSKALSVPEQAKAIKIVDAPTYEAAGKILVNIKGLRGEIDSAFDPIIESAHKTHKEAINRKKAVEAPLLEAENIIKPLMAKFRSDEEAKRRKAEDEERERQRKIAEDAQINKAVKLEEAGNPLAAEAVMNRPVQVAPVVIPVQTPKVDGVSFRQVWKFRVVDESLIPREYMIPDVIKIGGVARAGKGVIKIPGVEIFSEDSVAAGRG